MPELHETRMGQKLITSDIPRIIKVMEKIAKELEKLNDNLEKGDEKKEEK